MAAITFVQWSDDSYIPGPPTAGLVAWWDAAQITGVADGALLSAWPDMSGNGHHLAQPSTAVQPTYYNSTGPLVNGRPVVVCDHTNGSWMDTAGIVQAAPYTVVAVATGGTTAAERIFRTDSASVVNMYRSNGIWVLDAGLTLVGANVGLGLHFVAGIVNGATSSIQVDSVTTAGNTGTFSLANNFGVGGTSVTSAVNRWKGTICEMLIYATATPNLSALQAYAQTKWGTP